MVAISLSPASPRDSRAQIHQYSANGFGRVKDRFRVHHSPFFPAAFGASFLFSAAWMSQRATSVATMLVRMTAIRLLGS
jgi:hypothetical protein